MEITKEQIKELVRIAQAIDEENRIDDDVTGGYLEEPYNSIIERIYAVVNECEGKEVDAGENTLTIQSVSECALQAEFKKGYKAAIDNLTSCYKDIFD
jgi:regulator of RNase E activity RraB